MARPEHDVKLFTRFQLPVASGHRSLPLRGSVVPTQDPCLPEGYTVTVAQNVPVSRKCCSGQILLVPDEVWR